MCPGGGGGVRGQLIGLGCFLVPCGQELNSGLQTWQQAPLSLLTISIADFFFFLFSAVLVSDYSKGFGGKYGIDKDKVDKSAVGFEYQGKTEKHESQKGTCHLCLI